MSDPVVHPNHYNFIPGVECMDVVKHFSFLRGNAIKYLWRADHKGKKLEDLKKAIQYIQEEIKEIENKSEEKQIDFLGADQYCPEHNYHYLAGDCCWQCAADDMMED